MHKPNPEVRANAVSVRRLRVLPLSAQVIECELDAKLGHFLLEPGASFRMDFLFGQSFNSSGKRGKFCVVNMTRRGQIIKSGQLIGQAVQVDEVTPPSVAVRQVQPSAGGEPGHIAPLSETFVLTLRERSLVIEAIALVKEYAYIFAKSDLDLGEFTALDHRIDTDDAANSPHADRISWRRGMAFRQIVSRRCDSVINF